jgi:NAD(P)-dependent dehydrogenase (short-subunit alcohol dehydrogenase family)
LLADIAVQDEASRCIDYVTSCFGSIDVLINNAASRSRSPRDFFAPDEEYLDTTWRDVMATNLDGAFFMCQAAGRWMLEQKSGCIVNISSIYGVVGADQRIYAGSEQFGANMGLPAVYAASKAGILGLTRHLAAAWGPQGVRVNAVSPGGIENGQNEVFTRAFINRVPLGRMASTDDAVSATTFLSSDSASYINGHNLIVDGGLTIW